MATQGPSPEEMAIYEQMRQEISPQEFSNEMLAGASQVDPQAVAEFTQELQGLDMPPEALDALNDVVDEILANPEQYDQLRGEYLEAGLPEDILPEQFDPQFFSALNMAIDQMIAAPTGVQAFAQGGIAELKPIAKAIASYGRNGDTMLAHITPAEARMLRRRGGSGTINPDTGLPEFFLKKLWKETGGKVLKSVGKQLKSIGKAVKKFAQSSIGRIVLPIALGFFLGPAAAGFLGVTSTAGVAAVSGFVGSSLSTVAAGGNLKDALKAGAIGGLTAGATAGVMNGFDTAYAGPTTVGGQVDAFKGMLPGGTPAPAPGAGPQGIGANQMPVPDAAPYSELKMTGTPVKPFPEFFGDQAAAPATDPLGNFIQQNEALRTTASTPARMPGGTGTAPTYKPGGPTIGESFSKMGEGLGMGDKAASFDTFKQGATDLFSPGPTNAEVATRAQEIMRTTPGASLKDAMAAASKEMAPGILRTYGPAAVAGLGAMSAFGGFDTKPVEGGPITQSLMKPVTQRIAEEGTQRQMYMQGLPGVVYDDFGAPVFGQSTRLPTYDAPDYNSGAFGAQQGIMNLPSMYTPPPSTIGARGMEQPYNNANMYGNIMPRRYAEGGNVQPAVTRNNLDFMEYLKLHPDVQSELDRGVANFGTSENLRDAAYNHYAQYGKAEGRISPILGNTDPATMTPGQRDSAAKLAADKAAQEAAREKVAQASAMRRSQGSGQMYANINAGLSALAPEINPMDAADKTFGARNRQTQMTNLQQTYGPMLEGQRNAMAQQAMLLGQDPGQLPRPYPSFPITTMPVTLDRQVNAAPAVQAQPSSSWKGMFGLNAGGIVGLASGGYPRRTGQISGPGTEKSDSIPAMLSDGEFVMTAKAVRGAGKGSRRAGAKQMYKLMHQLEKNSERG
jgi:hypothetical protein